MSGDLRTLYAGAYSRLTAQVFVITDDLPQAQDAVTAAFVRALVSLRRIGRLDDPEAWLRAEAVRWLRRPRRHHPEPARQRIHTPFLDQLHRLSDSQRRVVGLATLMELPLVEAADLLGLSYSRAEHHLRAGHATLGEIPYPDVRSSRLRIEDAVQPPPYDELLATARPRRRRRFLAGAAVIVVLAGAGIAVPLLDQNNEVGPGTPITQVKFIDAKTGYAVVQPCRKSTCRLRLAVTTDGGKHWQQRIVPSAKGDLKNIVLTTCCGNAIALDYTRDKTAAHIVSDDGGHTWEQWSTQDSPLRDEQPTGTLPRGWIPISGLSGQAGLSALDTVHRVARPMSHAPDLAAATVIAPFEPGGRIWAFGAGKDADRLASSDNGGASWSTRPGPPLGRDERITTLFPTGDGGVYVQAQSGPQSKPDLWWQGPRPGTWQHLPQFDVDEAAINGVLPDGELWISDANLHSWRTEEHGQSLQPLPQPDVGGASIRMSFAGVAGPMIYAMPVPTAARHDLVFTSTDGTHWTTHVVALPGGEPPPS
ncbi:MAG TPA: hypothetical protein VHC49_03250 [Mycobacteriales bacterium]|nr:hypothetical protein [Mycobacteriales bacterium]